MRKNILATLVLFLILLSQAIAGEQSIKDFAYDLEKLFSIEARRTLEVGDVTHFTRQINTNGTAEASYHPLLNTIFLKTENLIQTGFMSYNVKSITLLKSEQPLVYPVKISTIFHELGHSEMDQFILNGITSEDRMILQLYKNEFVPWSKKNYPGVNPKTLFQEVYGYYRGNIIETLFADKTNIEILNGYNIYQHRCFLSFYLKKVIGTLSREEFGQILFPVNDPSWEEKYRNRVLPRYVFIEGKDIDLMKNPNDPFKDSWKRALWYYFSVNYHPPTNTRELAMFYKDNHTDRNFIKECRNKMWDEFHASR
ncbi:MAG: hypothetical protein EHM20_17510 [Alphaproteobacteria bacterium]|nr:MAG: hypothetical protein EHM20_17510 [Alphaproteobacteria bacterium]